MLPLSLVNLIPSDYKNVYVSSIFADELAQVLKFSGLRVQILHPDKFNDFPLSDNKFNDFPLSDTIFVYLGVSFKTESYSKNVLHIVSSSCKNILWSPCELDGSYENSFWPSDYSYIIESYFPAAYLPHQFSSNKNYTLVSPLLVSTTNLHSKYIENTNLDLAAKNLDLLSRDAFYFLKKTIEASLFASIPPKRLRNPIILTIAKLIWKTFQFILPFKLRLLLLQGVDNIVKYRKDKI
jgi:hypothetical protein